MTQTADLKKIKKQIEELDDGRAAGRGKLTNNLESLKGIITQLEATEETDESMRLLVSAHKLKKRTKVFIKSLWEEEMQLKKQVEELEVGNKKLTKELKALKEKNKTLEEQNADLKAQVDLLNAFREDNIEQKQEQNKSEGSEDDDDDNVDTFNADISLDTQAENTSKKTETTIEETGRARSESKITISIEKVKDTPPRPKNPPESDARSRARSSYEKPTAMTTTATSASSSMAASASTVTTRKRGPGNSVVITEPDPAQNVRKSQPGAPPAQPQQQEQAPVFDDNTVVDIITGLEVTIKERNWGTDQMLIPKDYSYWYQFKVKPKNRELLKFKDFAPKVFKAMRNHWGVSDEDYLRSFQYDNVTTIKGEGKSGAFFIFTKDKQFILKTATDRERDFLWQSLPYYWQYMRRHPNSLLPRFYGVYSMKHEGIGGMIRFVVMNNIFNTPYEPVERYDLKGSTVGRFTADKKKKPGAILKDLDIKESNRKLYLTSDLRKDFLKQLKLDSEFLAHNNVMDYSLLIGIYYETPENKDKTAQNIKKLAESKTSIPNLYKSKFQQHHNGMKFERPDGVTEIYYVGIIDVLIQYMGKKKLEGFVKSIAYAGEEVSVSQPSYYSARFYNFMKALVARPQNENEPESSSESEDPGIVPSDLPEPGSGDVIRPAAESVTERSSVDRRATVNTSAGGSISDRGSRDSGKRSVVTKDNRLSRVLDKNSVQNQQQ